MEIKAQGRLLGLVAICNQPSEQMRQEVDEAVVAGVFDLGAVLELIMNRLDEGAFAQQEVVQELPESVAHILPQLGDEPQFLGDQEALGERRGDVAFVGTELAKEMMDQPPMARSPRSDERSRVREEIRANDLSCVVDRQREAEISARSHIFEPLHRTVVA